MANWVDAESPQVGAVLRKIVAVVLEGGAELHPGLRLHERGGFMRVLCDRSMAGEDVPLVFIPWELLVPLEGATWEDRIDRLVMLRAPDGISALQKDLLDLHIALYNSTKKLRWFHQTIPNQIFLKNPELLDAVREIRPGTGDNIKSTAEHFIMTRMFETSGVNHAKAGMNKHILIPIMDLLNNRYGGASEIWFETGCKIMPSSQAETESECFLDYGGRRDVVDFALNMGYVDHSIPFAHSAPLSVWLDGVGSIRIEFTRSNPLHPLDPPKITFMPEEIILSHLSFHSIEPQRIRCVLSLALQASLKKRPKNYVFNEEMLNELAANIGLKNLQAIKEVSNEIVKIYQDQPSFNNILEALAIQERIILKTILCN